MIFEWVRFLRFDVVTKIKHTGEYNICPMVHSTQNLKSYLKWLGIHKQEAMPVLSVGEVATMNIPAH